MNDIDPNLFAYFALLIWPALALYLYSRLPIAEATVWTILGGYLLLPAGLDVKFKMIPAFNKDTIPSLTALVGCALYGRRLPKFFRGFGVQEVLLLCILIGPFITSMLNGDTIRIGNTVLPGVGAYDAGSASLYEFIFILPFFIGRQFLRGADDNERILRILVIAGLAYSLPMIFEIRMSPQLSNWIYGYHPFLFSEDVRSGGFRPVVFLANGLLVAFFTMTTTVAAAALWRTRSHIGALSFGGITGYLSFVLVLCKTLGALTYSIVAVPLVRWASPRLQLRVACILVTIAITYPMLRIADLVPTATILDAAHVVSVDRAESLNTRFVNEDALLEHAWQRPWFGWGRYARNRVYNGWEGRNSTITDGYWIITLGTFGLLGFAATFGLLGLSVFRAATAFKFARTMQEAVYLSALALIVAINIVDLLPNAPMSPWTWLLVGALVGRAEALRAVGHQRNPLRNLKLTPMPVQGTRGSST